MLKDLTQTQRLALRHIEPIYLVDIFLDGKTLHFSDREFRYDYGAGIIYYESYLYDLAGLGEEIRHASGGGPNTEFSLTVKNQRIEAYAYLIEMQADYEFVRRPVEIYELRLVEENETFSSDVRVCVQKGYIEKVRDITKEDFVINCSGRLFYLRDKLGLKKVSLSGFPDADPDDVGKFRNVVVGEVSGIVCRGIEVSGTTTIAQNMTATDPGNGGTLEVSDASVLISSLSQIDDEQIYFDNNNPDGNTLHLTSTQARGANSTIPVPHNKGAAIFDAGRITLYEVAAHPMQSIENVYVDGIRQQIGDNVYTYTGKPGDEWSGHEGTAVVFFARKPRVKKQINIETATDTGSHSHTVSGSSTVTRTGIGYSDPNNSWSGEPLAYDSNESTYAENPGFDGDPLVINFIENNLGTVISRKVKIVYSSALPSYYDDFEVKIGTEAYQHFNGTDGLDKKQTIYKTFAGNSWDLDITINSNGNHGFPTTRIYEVGVTITYGGGASVSAADGVNFSMTGNTTAETVIGKVITVDAHGLEDDASGTYTGTANALIERPDHVFKFILRDKLGQDSGSIGDSFAASGAGYAAAITGGYKFGFVMHEVAAAADELLIELARQCRSDFFDAAGKYELVFNPDAEPAADFVFKAEDLAAEPVFNFTDSVDIRNALTGYYYRDYIKSGDLGDRYEKTVTATKAPGDLPEDVEFPAVRSQEMCTDVLSWLLRQKEGVLVEVEVDVKWEAMGLVPCRYFSLADGLYSNKLYKVTGMYPDKKKGVISLKGCEFTTRA